MSIETLDDIIEEIADTVGIYGAEERSLYTANLQVRIMRAVRIEQKLGTTDDSDIVKQLIRQGR